MSWTERIARHPRIQTALMVLLPGAILAAIVFGALVVGQRTQITTEFDQADRDRATILRELTEIRAILDRRGKQSTKRKGELRRELRGVRRELRVILALLGFTAPTEGSSHGATGPPGPQPGSGGSPGGRPDRPVDPGPPPDQPPPRPKPSPPPSPPSLLDPVCGLNPLLDPICKRPLKGQ